MNNIESKIQKAAVEQIENIFRTRYKGYTLLLTDSKKQVVQTSPLFAVPNGGNRNIVTATTLKREGAKSGVADLILPINNSFFNQLWIEVKTDKGRLSANQKQWQSYCAQHCISYVICRSTQEIIDTVLEYMENVQ
jgi:hypothetical protein